MYSGYCTNQKSYTWFFPKPKSQARRRERKITRMGADFPPPLANFPSTPLSLKSTPLALSSWQSYMLRAILVSQLHGGNSSVCNCEARIASLALPGMKSTPQSTKIALGDGTISLILTKCVLVEEGHSHTRQQDSQPLPKTHPDTPSIQFCVSRACATHIIHHAQSQKYQQFCNFASTVCNR